MEKIRRLIAAKKVHLRFASSPEFLVGRAVFAVPDLVLIDVRTDTLALRNAIRDFLGDHQDVPVLALSDEPDHISVVDFVKIGVSGYFLYPDDKQKIADQLTFLYNEWSTKHAKQRFVEMQQETYDFSHIIGKSPALKISLDRAQKVIKNNAMTVLITGETGTGKELFARAIHYNGKNRNHPFIDIACSALPETLLESELFGFERGAFTDAKERKIGLFELAGEGSIFLDEIGDISLATQSKLLKVIEDRTMRRLGGVRDIPVRGRIIAATSADLEAKMRSGEFRKDLFHRLKILPIEVPPLRDRKDDIPDLVNEFLVTFNKNYDKSIKGITHEALRHLLEQEWEGNVRELKHSIERAVLLENSEWITDQDFEFKKVGRTREKQHVTLSSPAAVSSKDSDTLMLVVPFKEASIQHVQSLLVRKVLEQAGGNKLKASKILKISRPRLDRLMRGGAEKEEE